MPNAADVKLSLPKGHEVCQQADFGLLDKGQWTVGKMPGQHDFKIRVNCLLCALAFFQENSIKLYL
jgi:hypothetical protein